MSQGDLKLSVEACTAMLQQLAASDCDDASEARLVELALAAMRQAGWRDPQWAGDSTQPGDGAASLTTAKVEVAGECVGVLSIHVDTAAPPGGGGGGKGETLAAWAAWLGQWFALRREMQRLRDQSIRDHLTGARNRRFLYEFLTHCIDQASHTGADVTVLFVDIDNFKQFNDRFGFAHGDEILRQTAALLQSKVRDTDVVARLGGDEFVVVFWDEGRRRRPDSEHPRDVLAVTERFREALRLHRFPKLADDLPQPLTVSGGLASYPRDGQTPQALLDHADAMVRRAKAQGKNAIMYGGVSS